MTRLEFRQPFEGSGPTVHPLDKEVVRRVFHKVIDSTLTWHEKHILPVQPGRADTSIDSPGQVLPLRAELANFSNLLLSVRRFGPAKAVEHSIVLRWPGEGISTYRSHTGSGDIVREDVPDIPVDVSGSLTKVSRAAGGLSVEHLVGWDAQPVGLREMRTVADIIYAAVPRKLADG